ncbi:STIV orfB116 family protein [Nocardiopsis coralliicola]
MGDPLILLNSSIATAPGDYTVRLVSEDEARQIVARALAGDGVFSAIGHKSTAAFLSEVLETPVADQRPTIRQRPGQSALVLKLDQRLPDPAGKDYTREELDHIFATYGYSFYLMTRAEEPPLDGIDWTPTAKISAARMGDPEVLEQVRRERRPVAVALGDGEPLLLEPPHRVFSTAEQLNEHVDQRYPDAPPRALEHLPALLGPGRKVYLPPDGTGDPRVHLAEWDRSNRLWRLHEVSPARFCDEVEAAAATAPADLRKAASEELRRVRALAGRPPGTGPAQGIGAAMDRAKRTAGMVTSGRPGHAPTERRRGKGGRGR